MSNFTTASSSTGNWLSLLKWTLAQSSDGTAPSDYTSMSEEKKQWLENVMKELVKDETSTMNTIINEFIRYLEEKSDIPVKLTLDNAADIVTTIDEGRILFNLEEIRDIVEQIDMARVFAQFGGLECLLRLVEHGHSSMEVRCLAASTIGTLVQNNPTVQDMAFSGGVLDRLNSCFMGSESFSLCSKILYATSCLVRCHSKLEDQFVQYCAGAVLSRSLQSGDHSLLTRCMFLSHALLTSDSCTHSRINQLLPHLLPHCLWCLSIDDSVDAREISVLLCNTLLHTEEGWNLLHGAHLDAFLERISFREASINIALDEQLDGDEASLEMESLKKLRQLVSLSSPIIKYPRTERVVSVGDPVSRPDVAMRSDDEKKPTVPGGQLMLMMSQALRYRNIRSTALPDLESSDGADMSLTMGETLVNRNCELEMLLHSTRQLLDLSRHREKRLLVELELAGVTLSGDDKDDLLNHHLDICNASDSTGNHHDNYNNIRSFLVHLYYRGVWLVGLLIFQSCSSFILASNEQLLQRHPNIVYFLTMLVGAGGNAGNQAAVRVIRELALGRLQSKNRYMFVVKELLMALSLSGVVGVFGWVRVSLFGSILHLELISIVVALVLIVLISIVIGALLPLLFDTVGLDPANTSTTIQVIMDISGVLITCLVAAVLLDSSLPMVPTTTTLGSSA